MAALIDYTYFIGERNIPNTNRAEVLESLNALIAVREPEILTELFGYKMYKDFVAGIAVAPWLVLKNGAEFTYAGVLLKWRGLVNTQKDSLIADYVYYWYMRKNATQTTGVGEAATKTENSNRVSPVRKMTEAYNRMVDSISEMRLFIQVNAADYPDYRMNYADSYCEHINIFGL